MVTDTKSSDIADLALLVEVVDSNEFRPEFSQAEFVVTVEESVRPGTSLVHATATDNDVTSQLIYSVHNSRSVTSLELFDLDHVTGLLTVAQSLDRESISEHILTVVVSDSSSPVKRNFARVIVHVTDSNDHAPQWSGGVVQAVVLENAFVGSRVVTVVATDRDHGANAAVTYAIVSGNVGNYFSIDPVMGDISVARDLDCEEAAEFNLIVRAVDQGSAPLASTLPVFVTVRQSDHAPPRQSDHAPPRFVYMYTMYYQSCLDQGSAPLASALPVFVTVRQSDHAPPRFEEIRAVAEVEESVALGWIVWQARARSALSLTFEEIRAVAEVEESVAVGWIVWQARARSALSLTFEEIRAVAEVEESVAVGWIVWQARARSALSLTFEEIRAVAEVEESVAVGWIVWQARARSALSLTFEEIRAVAEVEESVAVGWIVWQARARSALSLTYDIEDGNSDRHFTINPTTGVVSTQHPLDYETRPSYNLTVSATNMAGVRAEIGLVVDVVDCNDNSPRFLETEYRGRISEDATPGSLVLTDSRSPLVVKAEDADSAILQYDIVESVPRRIFYIDPSTGAIRTQGQLDYEETQSVTFHVQVRDTGSPQLSGRDLAKVWVQVTDVNDCPPHFSQTEYNTTVLLPTFNKSLLPGLGQVTDVNDCPPHFSQTEYNTTVLLPTFNNVSIAQVQASDCDSPNITKLEYSIVTGNYENVYAMSGDSGLISLKNKSRGIHKSPHRLKVAVSDGPHTAFAFVNIKWEWSSQSTLKFQQDVYEAAIVENSTKIVTVAVVSVVGAELNEHVVFSLLNPSPLFHIGPTSGAIQTTGLRFDREHQDHFQLIVQGRSTTAGAEVRVAQTLVNISVLDINDNCPLFVGLPYYGTVPVDAAKGDVITKACGRFGSQYTNHVHAIDLDSGENGEVRYELMRGHGELFRVHRKTGEVILKQPLESQVREYQLSIAAYDGGYTRLLCSNCNNIKPSIIPTRSANYY
ncbi:hypothetical protein J6590_099247 [Homalodisca vitripennis]|nr:hypothetical protein J6590_099247 [Homalodisca vitripennis]